jgi:hypothetical protein
MPVDSMATVVTPQAASQSAKAIEIDGTGLEDTYGWLILVFRHTGVNFTGTDISTGRMQIEVFQVVQLADVGRVLFPWLFHTHMSPPGSGRGRDVQTR